MIFQLFKQVKTKLKAVQIVTKGREITGHKQVAWLAFDITISVSARIVMVRWRSRIVKQLLIESLISTELVPAGSWISDRIVIRGFYWVLLVSRH